MNMSDFFLSSTALLTATKDVTEVARKASDYQTISVVLMISAILCAVAALVLWFVFRIPHAFSVLTGIGARREIAQLERASEQNGTHHTSRLKKSHPLLSWDASQKLTGRMTQMTDETRSPEMTAPIPAGDAEATVLLSQQDRQITTSLQMPGTTASLSEETTVLGAQTGAEETTVLDQTQAPGETTVLSGTADTVSGQGQQRNRQGFRMEQDLVCSHAEQSLNS